MVIGRSASSVWYLETPEFFDDLFLRLTNSETPRSRLQYRVRTPDGAEYWVFIRGR